MEAPALGSVDAPLDDSLRRWRATRDPADFAAFFDAAAPRLFRAAVRLTRDGAAAEDVTQETFLAVLETSGGWDPSRPAWPWLTGILHRKAVDAWRRRERDSRPLPVAEPREADPGDAAILGEEVARVHTALDALGEPYRRAAILRWRYGLEPGEIADALGEPPGTVRSWLSRARERLERRLRAAPLLAVLAGPARRGLDQVRETVVRAARRGSATTSGAAGAVAAATAGGLLMTKKTLAVVAAVVLLGGAAILQRSLRSDPAPSSTAPPPSLPAPMAAAREPAGAPLRDGSDAPEVEGRATCSLDVRTVDGNSRPVAGALIEAYRRRDADARGHEVFERLDLGLARAETRGGPTDAAGTTVVRLPAGSWFLVARSEGRAAAEGEATVAPGRDSGVVRLVLWPACTLDGVVLSAPGRPRSGGEVQAVAAGSGGLPASRAAVDGSGRFRLAGLRPGRHSLSYAPRAGVVLSVGVVEVPGAAHVEILAADGLVVGGRVVADDTGAPLEGAEVAVSFGDVYSSRHHQARTRTGADGRFRLDGIPPGRVHRFHVRHDRFLTWPDGGPDAGPELEWGFAIGGEGETVEREIRLRRGASVRGRVVLRDGTPVPGATVLLFGSVTEGGMQRPRCAPEAVSGPDGSFEASPVLPGRNLIIARAPGLAAPGLPWSSFNALSEPATAAGWIVEVPESGTLERDIVLARGATVEGVVVDARGSPVPGCVVGRSPPWGALGPRDGWERWHGFGFAAPTDAAGAFLLSGMEEGEFAVEVRGPGGLRGVSKRLRAREGERLQGVQVRIESGAVVAGTIVGDDGSPAPGTRLVVTVGESERDAARMDWLRNAGDLHPVGQDGRFRVEGLAAGDWTFHAVAPGRAPASKTLHALRPGSVKEDLSLVLGPGRSLEGRVVDAEGKAVVRAAVSVIPVSEGPQTVALPVGATTDTDSDGRFRQDGLGDGTHRVRVSHPGFVETVLTAAAGGLPVEVRLDAPHRISGRVRTESDGAPAAGVLVTCFPAESIPGIPRGREARTGPDGSFAVDGLAPGPHVLYAGGPADDFIRARVDGVEAGSTDVDVRLRRGRAISGRLLDSEGRAVTGAQVEARASGPASSEDRGRYAISATGSDGGFVLRGLADGPFGVVATVLRGGAAHQPSAKEVAAGTTDLRLVLGAEATAAVPPTERPLGDLRIEGRLVVRGGAVPPSGIPVFARPVVPAEVGVERTVALAARTDERGAFVIEGLDPGGYVLLAGLRHEVYAPVATSEPVEAGSTGIVLELIESVGLAGRIAGDGAEGVQFVRAVPVGPAARYASWSAVGEGGSFHVRGLPPGPVLLYGWTETGSEVRLGEATAPAEGIEVRIAR